MPDRDQPAHVRVGTSVEVRSRFERTWHGGYVVHELSSEGITLRRESDETILPSLFGPDEVRKARRRTTWWT